MDVLQIELNIWKVAMIIIATFFGGLIGQKLERIAECSILGFIIGLILVLSL